LISEYFKERNKWSKFGKPLRTQEQMDELFTICNNCPEYKKYSDSHGQCSICGCHIKKEGTFLNKIAWSTTRCPLVQPKWVETETRFAKEINITPGDLSRVEQEHNDELAANQPPAPEPVIPPCGCK